MFGAVHAQVRQFVFCDGAVRAIRYTVDPQVFHNACCRNDGVPYNIDSL